MRIVRRQVEQIWAEHPPGQAPADFVPYDTGETAIEVRLVLNRFETRLLRAWQAANSGWHETVVWRVGRAACYFLARHNTSCRGNTRCALDIARQRAR